MTRVGIGPVPRPATNERNLIGWLGGGAGGAAPGSGDAQHRRTGGVGWCRPRREARKQ